MALLAELSSHVQALRNETTGTNALGLILRSPAATAALVAALRAGAPALPDRLNFTMQDSDADGRPDLVARDRARQVLFVEGKFWFGFTEAQSNGAYLRRLETEWHSKAPGHAHVGTLLFVVPPSRVVEVVGKVTEFYTLTDPKVVGGWRFGTAPGGVVVAVCSWQQLLLSLIAVGDTTTVSDCQQLLDLLNLIDQQAFQPWSTEQLTDRDTARRIAQLVHLVTAVRDQAIRDGVATHIGSRRTTKQHDLSYGKILTLGGVGSTLTVSPVLWSMHGASPIWLRFRAGQGLARAAFPTQTYDTSDGVALPVPIAANRTEDEVVAAMIAWLHDVADLLSNARAETATPVTPELDPADDTD